MDGHEDALLVGNRCSFSPSCASAYVPALGSNLAANAARDEDGGGDGGSSSSEHTASASSGANLIQGGWVVAKVGGHISAAWHGLCCSVCSISTCPA